MLLNKISVAKLVHKTGVGTNLVTDFILFYINLATELETENSVAKSAAYQVFETNLETEFSAYKFGR